VEGVVEEVRRIFGGNVEEVYLLGSAMRLILSERGLCPPPDHQPRDLDVIVRVRDLDLAIEQYLRTQPDPRLHIFFDDQLTPEGMRHLKIYPEEEVSWTERPADRRSLLRLLGCLLLRDPRLGLRQAWALRRSIWRALRHFRGRIEL